MRTQQKKIIQQTERNQQLQKKNWEIYEANIMQQSVDRMFEYFLLLLLFFFIHEERDDLD